MIRARKPWLVCVVCALFSPMMQADSPDKPILEKDQELKLKARRLAFNSRGTELALCVGTPYQQDVKILDARTFKELRTFIAAGNRAAFALKDKFLVVSGVFQSGIELLDRGSGESTLLNYGSPDFQCHAELNLIAYRGQGEKAATINVLDLAKKKVLLRREIDDPVSVPVLGGFSQKGGLLTSFTKDIAKEGKLTVASYLQVWSPPYDKEPVTVECDKEAQRVRALHGRAERDDHEARRLAISPDEQYAALGTAQGKIDLWNLKTRKRLQTLKHSPGVKVEALAFSPDGRLLASLASSARKLTASAAGEVLLHDLKSGRTLGKALAGKGTTDLVFFPDSKRLATLGDGNVKIWKIGSSEVKR